ncbi:MAG: SRPBCC family protein [Flavobacteriales bacterium]|nr:SRPBCC family protein [Flavobacteriales bacterium]
MNHTTTTITVETVVSVPVEKVWKAWTTPEDITQWNQASEDWHTPNSTNDLRVGGKFTSRMEAKDGSAGFDFEGIYEEVITQQRIVYSIADGRKVKVTFSTEAGGTKVTETFDAENVHSVDMQRTGWQAILDSFKKHVEGKWRH